MASVSERYYRLQLFFLGLNKTRSACDARSLFHIRGVGHSLKADFMWVLGSSRLRHCVFINLHANVCMCRA